MPFITCKLLFRLPKSLTTFAWKYCKITLFCNKLNISKCWQMSGITYVQFFTNYQHLKKDTVISWLVKEKNACFKSSILRVYMYIKRILHDLMVIQNFSASIEKYFTSGRSKWVKYFSAQEEKFHISKQPFNVLFTIKYKQQYNSKPFPFNIFWLQNIWFIMYRNFRTFTCTADYPQRSIFVVRGKNVQQITRTGLLPAPQNQRKSWYCIIGIRTHKLGVTNIPWIWIPLKLRKHFSG